MLSPGEDIGYTLADLDSIYRDSMQDTFGAGHFALQSLADDTVTQDVEVEELSPENLAQATSSQDSLDVMLPAQMLNTNMFDIPDFPVNFLENLDDEALNDADGREPPSPGDLVIDCSNHNSTSEEQGPEIDGNQTQPDANAAPDVMLNNKPVQYLLEVPADNVLGLDIFDDESNDLDSRERLGPNLLEDDREGLSNSNI